MTTQELEKKRRALLRGAAGNLGVAFALVVLSFAACISSPKTSPDAGSTSAPMAGQEPVPVAPHYPPAHKMGAVAEGQTSTGSLQAIPLVATDDAGGVAVAVTSTAAGSLPTGGATAAKQDTGNTSLASIDTKTPSKGTAVMTGSTPVTIATNDTLGLTLATNALQTTGNTSLASIKTDVDNIPAKGTAAMAGSMPVTIATDDTIISTLKQPTASSAVTPSDSTVLTCTKGLWVGTAGNLSLKLSADSSAVTWNNVPSGIFIPGSVIRVMAATTATNIVCLQ